MHDNSDLDPFAAEDSIESSKMEDENGLLHLRNARLCNELKNKSERVTYLHNKVGDMKQRRSQYMNKLKEIHSELICLKGEQETLRSLASDLPNHLKAQCDLVQGLIEDKATTIPDTFAMINDLREKLTEKDEELSNITEKLGKEKQKRRSLHNTVLELKGNIRVHCRVRPVVDCDIKSAGSSASPSKCVEPVTQVIDEENLSVRTGRKCKTFEFERVYGPEESQEAVFNEVEPLVQSLLDGYNVCVMAYGQTASGKTHTMLGGHKNEEFHINIKLDPEEGIVPRTVRELYRLIGERPFGMHAVELSIVEIYNNELHDLLASPDLPVVRHDIVKGVDGSVHIPTVTSRRVDSISDVFRLIKRGLAARCQSATLVHEHSSRSHLITVITVTTIPGMDDPRGRHSGVPGAAKVNGVSQGTPPSPTKRNHTGAILPPSPTKRVAPGGGVTGVPGSPSSSRIPRYTTPASRSPSPMRKSLLTQGVVKTKLQLVDLAGSECAGVSGTSGLKLRETAHINRSLSALSDVLGALADNRQHVPYRNSKLTHLLQDAIGGDSKLLIFICISPTRRQMAETLQSLGFGQRARQIQRGPVRKRSSSAPGGGALQTSAAPNGDGVASPKPLRAKSASLKALCTFHS